jgi:peptide/nickel transport system ATP-binding protein
MIRHDPTCAVIERREMVLAVSGLTKRFGTSTPLFARLWKVADRVVLAAADVSFTIERGRTLALVGESGCGKSTVARCIAGILTPTAGTILFMGVDMAKQPADRAVRRHLQMIFQDPYASLNPRWRVGRIVAEPIRTHGLLSSRLRIEERVVELLCQVGLSAGDAGRYPHEFSGGQRQRISIARALASEPDFIVCDEPTSALDVSIQAQILNLMRGLQERLRLTYLLISHNLSVVAHMADTIAVMYLGRLVEIGDASDILDRPLHPYTRMLLEAVPDIEMTGRRRQLHIGEAPSPFAPPAGCAYHPRCPLANERCARERPHAVEFAGVRVACHAVTEGRIDTGPAHTTLKPQ